MMTFAIHYYTVQCTCAAYLLHKHIMYLCFLGCALIGVRPYPQLSKAVISPGEHFPLLRDSH